jgi:hypothetical protein
LGSAATIVSMPELGHDIVAVGIALLATAIFAAMAWASRPH